LQTVFAALPRHFPRAIAVVIHRHKEGDEFLAEYLQKNCSLPVAEAIDKDPIVPGRIYVAPANYHLMVDEGYFSLSIDEEVQFARPSVDVLFESAAELLGPGVIGVILTGANHDGAEGARAIRENGGIVVVEEPSTAACPTMPAAAIEASATGYISPLEGIVPLLVRLIEEGIPS